MLIEALWYLYLVSYVINTGNAAIASMKGIEKAFSMQCNFLKGQHLITLLNEASYFSRLPRNIMVPDEVDGQVMLRTACRGMERYIDQWELAQNGVYEGVAWDAEVADYQDWKDKYDISYSGQSCRQSRYSTHWDKRPNGALIDSGALESKYDPFDERYRAQGGFLRA